MFLLLFLLPMIKGNEYSSTGSNQKFPTIFKAHQCLDTTLKQPPPPPPPPPRIIKDTVSESKQNKKDESKLVDPLIGRFQKIVDQKVPPPSQEVVEEEKKDKVGRSMITTNSLNLLESFERIIEKRSVIEPQQVEVEIKSGLKNSLSSTEASNIKQQQIKCEKTNEIRKTLINSRCDSIITKDTENPNFHLHYQPNPPPLRQKDQFLSNYQSQRYQKILLDQKDRSLLLPPSPEIQLKNGKSENLAIRENSKSFGTGKPRNLYDLSLGEQSNQSLSFYKQQKISYSNQPNHQSAHNQRLFSLPKQQVPTLLCQESRQRHWESDFNIQFSSPRTEKVIVKEKIDDRACDEAVFDDHQTKSICKKGKGLDALDMKSGVGLSKHNSQQKQEERCEENYLPKINLQELNRTFLPEHQCNYHDNALQSQHQLVQRRQPPWQLQQSLYRPHTHYHQRYHVQRTMKGLIWKSLMNGIERGLDSLAGAENMVVDRTNRLSNIISSSATVRQKKNSKSFKGRSKVARQHLSKRAIGSSRNFQLPISPSYPYKDTDAKVDGNGSSKQIPETDAKESRRMSYYDVMNNRNAFIRAGGLEDYNGQINNNCNIHRRKNSPFAQLQHNHHQKSISLVESGATTKQLVPKSPLRKPYDLDSSSWLDKVSIMMPLFPRMPSIFLKMLGRGSGSHRDLAQATLDVWKKHKEEKIHRKRWLLGRKQSLNKSGALRGKTKAFSSTPPLANFLLRCNNGKSTSLLTQQDQRKCNSIGCNQAILDIVCSGLIIFGIHQVFLSISTVTVQLDGVENILDILNPILTELMQGWCLHAFLAAFFVTCTNYVIWGIEMYKLSYSVSNEVGELSQYAQLYMRLVTGHNVDKHIPEQMKEATIVQIVSLVQVKRLQWFVTFVLTSMIMMTVSVAKPIFSAILKSIILGITAPELRSWPVLWSQIGIAWKHNILSLIETIKDLLAKEFSTLMENPMVLGFQFSAFAALIAVVLVPTFECRRKILHVGDNNGNEAEVDSVSSCGTVATLSNLGISSASRLNLLSRNGRLEGTLERWRASLSSQPTFSNIQAMKLFLRKLSYFILSSLFILAPILVYHKCLGRICVTKNVSNPIFGFSFDSITDVSILLFLTLKLCWKSVNSAVHSSHHQLNVGKFIARINAIIGDVSGGNCGSQTQLGSSITPNLGLSVKDLWAAHTSKKAWAVRGASFECRNGEIIAILGEDASGKTRLLTAIAEVLVNPSKRSLTTNKVRGIISVAGLDASKWDSEQLKRKLGLFLNDVRTIADNAEFMSGFTLEDILEPIDGPRNRNGATRAITIALNIMGLSTTLIEHLPKKLSTVVTTNENELKPSALRPRCHALSPSEWLKVLLTRVLAQTIFDNENFSNTPLVGSLLLLDDLTLYLSEHEELKIIQALRRTGAATVFTSSKWLSGRLADRIIVIKEGAIIESGTHSELLARGQQSLYATKWQMMTSR